MVKLAQHINWPPSEAASTIHHGGRKDSRVFPHSTQGIEQDILVKDVSKSCELVKDVSKPCEPVKDVTNSCGVAKNVSKSCELKKAIKPASTHLQDGRQRKTLADLFQSPSVVFVEEPIVVYHRDPDTTKATFDAGKTQSMHRSSSVKEIGDLAELVHAGNPKKAFGSGKSEHLQRTPSSKKSWEERKFEQMDHLAAAAGEILQKGKRFPKGLFALHADTVVNAPNNMKHLETEQKPLSIDIPNKMIGLAWLGTEPLLLAPGSYVYPANSFILEQLQSEKTGFIKHGYLHRVLIKEGHLGVAWVDGHAVLLEPGVSIHACSVFSYTTTDDQTLTEKEFVLGPFRFVTVLDSEVGIKFCNRKPEILYSGRHCISISKVEVFAGFESLLRRQSFLTDVVGISSDGMDIRADLSVEWQIKPEDAAAARLANVTDVEGAVCEKLRRAFNLAMWEWNGQDIPKLQSSAISADIHRECTDLFEEGWTVTLWELHIKNLVVVPSTLEVKS